MANHIQIGAIAPRIQYTGDGVQTVFTYPFAVFQDTDLNVYVDSVRQTAGYVVAGAGNTAGGAVTFSLAPVGGAVVTLTRNLAIQRTSDFQDAGEFRAKVINDELDYMTAALQQVADDQSRSLQLSVTQTGVIGTAVPTPVANTALMWNATADGLSNGPSADAIAGAQANALQSAADRVQTGLDVSAADASFTSAAISETNAAASAASAAASAAGIYWKEPCLNRTTANVSLSGEQTIDGVLTATSRILVMAQTNAAENGVYVTASGPWARATPMDTWAEFIGAVVIVSQGTTYADTAWICTVDAGGTLGTTAITWINFATGGLLGVSNLSDVANAAISLANIGGMTDVVPGGAGNLLTSDGTNWTSAVPTPTGPFTKSFTSADQTLTGGGLLTLAHGLGTPPTLVQAYLRNTTAELGYSVGDVTPVSVYTSYIYSTSLVSAGASIVSDSTNINIRIGASGFAVLDHSTGVMSAITNTNWSFFVRAWA